MASRFARGWLALPPLFYLFLPTRNYYWDGLAFAINVEKLAPLRDTLHPNHLIYTLVSLWLYRAAQAAGLNIRALFLMQGVNALLAGAAVVMVYRALVRRQLSVASAVAGALLFGFAATWWRFASDANAYIASVLLVLCANDLIEEGRSVYLAGLAHAGAMLFHELAIFYLSVVWFRRREWRERTGYSAAALVPVALAYVAAYRAVFGRLDPAGFVRWIVAYTPDAGFSFQPLRDLAFTLTGTLRLFFGGKMGQVVPGVVTVVSLAALIAVLAALAWRLRLPRFTRPGRDLLLWVGLYVAFLLVWMPQNTFYRLFYLAPLLLLLAASVRRVTIAAAAAVFLWNWVFLIYPQSRVESNAPLDFALAQQRYWPAGTPIVFHVFHPDLWTISYFNQQASWIGLDRLDMAVLEKGLEWARERKQPLWLEGTAYDFLSRDAEGKRWLDQRSPASVPLVRSDARHEFRFYPVR